MNTKQNKNTAKELDADVLYQKLGDRWFAFSLIEDEVFMSPVDEETIEGIRAQASDVSPSHNETI